MANFIVNKNKGERDENEVHNMDKNCGHLPLPSNRVDLGSHDTCCKAVIKAWRLGYKGDGCKHCCPECHTS